MGQSAWTIAGTVVGAYFGYPQLGALVGSAIGSVADPTVIQGPRIGETGVQTSQEGAPRGIVFGTAPVTGNVMCVGPLLKADVETTEGKGGPVTSTEHCYRTFAIRICEGPIGGVLRIWEDNKLVYDVRPGSLMLQESEDWIFGSGIWLGTEDQLPDPFLNINVPPYNHPAHRGTAYMTRVFVDLTDRRGSIPNYKFEVAGTTESEAILGPLVVGDWQTGGNGIPVHSLADTTIYPTSTPSGTSYSDFATAAAAAAAIAGGLFPPAGQATTFADYLTGTNAIPHGFDGGADLADDPQYVYYQLAYVRPDQWGVRPPTLGYIYCSSLQSDFAATPDDGLHYAAYFTGTISYDGFRIMRLRSSPSLPGGASDPWNGGGNNCINYSPEGYAQTTPVVSIAVRRAPSVPEDSWTKVVGTAKQLCAVEYRSGVLYQNALGPVLLPGDPNYDDDDFWEDAHDAAVLAGLLKPGVTAWPVVVSEYATGFSTVAGNPVQLGLIVSKLHERCQVPPDKYDVSELTDLVAGLVLAGIYTGADAINVLRSPYFFDKSEHDKKLYYPKRGAAVVETLTFDDLVEAPTDDLRQQAIEYPKKMHLFYQHAVSGYAVVKATSARSSPDARVVGEATLQIPVVLNEDQAIQTVSKLHKVAWTEADGEVEISVPESFLAYIPSDCIGLSLRGTLKRYRIETADYAAGVIKWKMKHDRQSAYTSRLTGVPIPPPTLPPSTITGDTLFAFLDIASRIDSEDDLNYYVAGSGGLDAWYGWQYQRSIDGGANYVNVTSSNVAAVMGTLVDDVPSASEYYTDTTNVVRIQLNRESQTLDSLSDAQFLSENGAFALEKADGSYEILQYRDAVTDSNGIVDLSTLHRGLLNSVPAAHIAGARFVMLDRALHIPAQSGWIGQSITSRAVSFGQSPELGYEESNTYVGRSQTEWPVAYLTLSRDGSDIITATWTPRHRFGTDDFPVESVNFRGYRITLDDGVLPAVTFDQGAAGFTYDASALGAPLTVTVSALNRITGAGPATSGSV